MESQNVPKTGCEKDPATLALEKMAHRFHLNGNQTSSEIPTLSSTLRIRSCLLKSANIAIAAIILSYFAVLELNACEIEKSWSVRVDSSPSSTINQVIQKAKEIGLLLEQEEDHTKCQSSISYSLRDIDTNTFLLNIPVPLKAFEADDGRYLDVRLAQVLKTPREQLLSLRKAKNDFFEDSDTIAEELRLYFYPTGVFDSIETDLYIYTHDVCTWELYRRKILKDEQMINITFTVPPFMYVPGRTNYEPASIYQKGDLRKRIFSNKELLEKLTTLHEINAKCDPHSKFRKLEEVLYLQNLFHSAREKLN